MIPPPQNESELASAFAKLRAHDARGAPSFDALARAAPRRAPRALWLAAPACAMAAALLVFAAAPTVRSKTESAPAQYTQPPMTPASATGATVASSAQAAEPRQRIALAATDLPLEFLLGSSLSVTRAHARSRHNAGMGLPGAVHGVPTSIFATDSSKDLLP